MRVYIMHASANINPRTTYFEEDLPAIPGVVAELIALTEKPDADVEEVARTLEQDPALCLAILRVSNSPYFGMRHKISDMRLALVILGMREVRTIALGISTYSSMRDSGEDPGVARSLWANSLHVGALSKMIAATYMQTDTTIAFISGLLTNVGKAFFLKRLPEHYSKLLKGNRFDWAGLIKGEEELFGCNHLEIGAALLNRWNLPPVLADIVWRHYPDETRPIREAVEPDLVAAVRLARYLVDTSPKQKSHPAIEDGDTNAFIGKIAGADKTNAIFLRLLQIAKETCALPAVNF